jgi:RNA polymerase sigma-70 factor (ECF subfamily)
MEAVRLEPKQLEKLIEGAKKLDEAALSLICKEFYSKIFHYFFYRARTKEDAEDLTSEVFVRMVTSIKSQRGNFTAWLFRIAHNLMVDYYRKLDKKKEVSLEDEEVKAPLTANQNINSRRLEIEDIKKLFDNLTEEQKEVMILKFIEGYSTEEVSKIMKKKINAVKALQFRASLALREVLKKEG